MALRRSSRGILLLLVGMWMASAWNHNVWVVVIHSEEHRGCRHFAAMEVKFMSFATPFFLVPVDVQEYCTCASYFSSHESRYNQKKAEPIAVGEQRRLKL